MTSRVSPKGQIVLPPSVRNRLGIAAGDSLEIDIAAGRIVLTPRKKTKSQARIVTDPRTGLSAIDPGPGMPVLTSEQVEKILANFP